MSLELFDLVHQGKLVQPIFKIYPLDQVSQAHVNKFTVEIKNVSVFYFVFVVLGVL